MHVVSRLIVGHLDIAYNIEYSTLHIFQCLKWLVYQYHDHSRNQPRSEARRAAAEWGPFPSIALFACLLFLWTRPNT